MQSDQDLIPASPIPQWNLWDAVSQSGMIGLLVLAAVLLIGLILVARFMDRMGKRKSVLAIIRDNGGSATIEFALVLPILLFIILALAQTTFLMSGNLFVNYAAFTATRTAIVQVPANRPPEPFNVVVNRPGYAKYEAVRRSAVLAVSPIGGRNTEGGSGSGSGGGSDALIQALREHYSSYGQQTPAWVNNLIGPRYQYANDNTFISFFRADGTDSQSISFIELSPGSSYQYGPRDAVTIRVDHRFYLSVPYIRKLFADGADRDLGNPFSDTPNASASGTFTLISSQCTLTNEGVVDMLPPTPTLPRINRNPAN